MKQQSKINKKWIIYWVLAIGALIAMTYAGKNLRFVETDKKVAAQVYNRNNESYRQLIREVESDVHNWSPNINDVVNELASFKGAAFLTYCMAKDRIKGTSCTEDRITEVVNRYIVLDAIHQTKKLEERLRSFNKVLEKNRDSVLSVNTLSGSREYDAHLTELLLRIDQVTVGFKKVAFSTSVSSGLLVLPIMRQVERILSGSVKRFIATQGVSGTFALVDGPIPIGDAIGLVIEVVGIGWATYELYKAQVVLKEKIRKDLKRGLKNYKNNLYNQTCGIATDLLDLYNEQNQEIYRKLKK